MLDKEQVIIDALRKNPGFVKDILKRVKGKISHGDFYIKKEILEKSKTIAIIGLSPKVERDSNMVQYGCLCILKNKDTKLFLCILHKRKSSVKKRMFLLMILARICK